MRRAQGLAICGVVAASVAPWSLAGASNEPPSLPPELIKSLDAPSLAERDRATAQIAEGEASVRMHAVERAMSDPSLSPEQRERLRSAGLRLFSGTPRAAMGIQMQAIGDGSVTITPASSGFDAAKVIRDGDAVRSADGRPVTTRDDLRRVIISHNPDEEITLSIIRSGEPMTVKVKLGRLADLSNAERVDEQLMAGAWEERLARVSPQTERPLGCDLSADRWGSATERARTQRGARSEPMLDPFSQEAVRSPLVRPPAASMTMGGQGREPAARSPDELAMARRENALIVDLGANGGRARRQAELNNLLQRAGALGEAIDQLEQRMMLPGTAADERARLKAQFDQLQIQHRAYTEAINEAMRRQIGR